VAHLDRLGADSSVLRGVSSLASMTARRRETFAPVTLAHIAPTVAVTSRLLRLGTLPPQRGHERGLASRRHARAVAVLSDGLHELWADRG
jgi:hypothetical protein